MTRWRRCGAAALLSATLLAACSAEQATTTDPTSAPPGTGSATPQTATSVLVLSPEGNNLVAYAVDAPFAAQRVSTAAAAVPPQEDDPDGIDINGQVCTFTGADGRRLLVAGEDTGQPERTAGWGVFALDGEPGSLGITELAHLVPTYPPGTTPDNYGCGVLSDGRIVTTDIGNEASGAANGQLTIWFPPFTGDHVAFCKLDTEVATGQSIAVVDDDVYVASPRPAESPTATAAGVFRYTGPFPTGPDATGGCGRTDSTGAPLADTVVKQRVLTAGEHGLLAPAGLAAAPDGHWFVSSVVTGVIVELDAGWQVVRTVLEPAPGEQLGAEPYPTGTPLGLAVGPDGTLYYADLGLIRGGELGFGPGPRTGSVRRITFVDGAAQPPETMADDLAFPDGLGILALG